MYSRYYVSATFGGSCLCCSLPAIHLEPLLETQRQDYGIVAAILRRTDPAPSLWTGDGGDHGFVR